MFNSAERGKYLTPVEHGLPASTGINYLPALAAAAPASAPTPQTAASAQPASGSTLTAGLDYRLRWSPHRTRPFARPQ